MFYSQCPECSAVRVVATEEIGSGDIVVNCESCGESYNLAWHLLDRLPSIRKNGSDDDNLVKDKLRVESEVELPPPFQPDWSLPGLNADSELDETEQVIAKSKALVKPAAPAATAVTRAVAARETTPSPAAARDRIESPAPRITREQQQPIINAPPLTQALAPVVGGRSVAPPPPAALKPPGTTTDREAPTRDEDLLDSTTFDSTDTEIYTHSEPLEDEEPESAADRAAARRRRRKRKRQKEKKKAITRARYWALGSFGLVLLLGLQIRMFYLDTVFQSSGSQPVAGFFCKIFSCPTPLPRDLGLLQINNTAVGNHPDVPNAIRISTTVSNVAEHDQAYPDVQLTLTDPNGKIISRRTFSPGQYVPGYVAGRERLQSAETGTFQFDISNPSKRAIGFEVELVQ